MDTLFAHPICKSLNMFLIKLDRLRSLLPDLCPAKKLFRKYMKLFLIVYFYSIF